ncbi:glycosylphosphatidylinositol-anchored high density lipoprotein-binding 1 [Sigmodon hispidus]
MKAFRVVVLVLLLSGQSGSSWTQEDSDVDLEPENYGYDDDYEEEEEETNMIPGSRDKDFFQCYTCQSLQSGESCNQTQRCYHSKSYCTTFISHSNTDKGLLTTYSMWCTDTCEPIIKTMSGTQVTQTCCQSTLCNIPPWQSPQDSLGGRAGSPVDGGVKNPKDGIDATSFPNQLQKINLNFFCNPASCGSSGYSLPSVSFSGCLVASFPLPMYSSVDNTPQKQNICQILSYSAVGTSWVLGSWEDLEHSEMMLCSSEMRRQLT